MKIKVYTRFLNMTSFLLNICVKKQKWNYANKIIEFRKKHIAKTLRCKLKDIQ